MIYIFLILGLILILLSAITCRHTFVRLSGDNICKGTVIDYKVNYIPKSGVTLRDTYFPVIEFQHNGEKYTFTSLNGLPKKAYRCGEEVELLFCPENPEKNPVIKTFRELWSGAVIMLILGLIFLSAAAAAVLKETNTLPENSGLKQTVNQHIEN
jgi:ABC-type transport system involved in multi-copper enzyme maturation permease subunit